MSKRMVLGQLSIALVLLGLSACGGGDGGDVFPISVTFEHRAALIDQHRHNGECRGHRQQ